MSTELVMTSNHLILYHPPSPPTFDLSQHQGLFKWASFCIRWPKYWSFSFSISPSNEYSGLISFRMDWLDLLAVQGTLKSLLQQFKSIRFFRDGWMASPTQWTWVCVISRSWWWTGGPGVLQSMGSQRVEHDWVTELICVSFCILRKWLFRLLFQLMLNKI